MLVNSSGVKVEWGGELVVHGSQIQSLPHAIKHHTQPTNTTHTHTTHLFMREQTLHTHYTI